MMGLLPAWCAAGRGGGGGSARPGPRAVGRLWPNAHRSGWAAISLLVFPAWTRVQGRL